MYPVMMQPLYPVARANVETCLRIASTFASGMRQIGELNEKTIQFALGGMRTQRSTLEASTSTLEASTPEPDAPLPAFFTGLPGMAFSYFGDVLSIVSATAVDLVGSVAAHASQTDADTPKLVLEADRATPPSGDTAIVDASGAVVAHVRT
jgi:hypothetical protein